MTKGSSLELVINDAMRQAALIVARSYHIESQVPPENRASTQKIYVPPQLEVPGSSSRQPLVWATQKARDAKSEQSQLSQARTALKSLAITENKELLATILNRTVADRLLNETLNQLVALTAADEQLSMPYNGRYYGPQLGPLAAA